MESVRSVDANLDKSIRIILSEGDAATLNAPIASIKDNATAKWPSRTMILRKVDIVLGKYNGNTSCGV